MESTADRPGGIALHAAEPDASAHEAAIEANERASHERSVVRRGNTAGPLLASWKHVRGASRLRLGLLSSATLVACGTSLPHPPYGPQATTALTPVEAAPPPGRIEHVPKQPSGADAWVDGEWILRHGRWYWLLGRWVKAPAGAQYSPWVAVRAPDGTLFYARSVWVDARGSAVPPPPAITYATASGEAVFDAEGELSNTGRNLQTAPTRPAPSSP